MSRRLLRLHGARAPLEKTEQAATVKLLATLGADVYVVGTRHPRGRACPTCGTFVQAHQGTCQTPGLPDLVVFLPGPAPRRVCFIEQKREGGQLSPTQTVFRDVAQTSTALYICGTLDDVIACLTSAGYLRRPTGRVTEGRRERRDVYR